MAPLSTLALLLLSLSLNILAENIDCRGDKCKCKEAGHCQIFCDSVSQQCRGAKLRCMPGSQCTIYCLGDGSCLDAKISGNDATHVDLLCNGSGSCQAAKYYCGSGDCILNCANNNDCANIRVLTAAKAQSWKCSGKCPAGLPPPVVKAPAPSIVIGKPTKKPTVKQSSPTLKPTFKPTKKPTVAKPTAPTPKPVAVKVIPTPRPSAPPVKYTELTCKGTGKKCKCSNNAPCHIRCGKKQCTENILVCPKNHECRVTCDNDSCLKATIQGPRSKKFELNCVGTSACGDAFVESQLAADVDFVCSGKDSCKGALTTLNCGTGLCEMDFTGEAAGTDAKVYTNQALGFQCVGRYVFCPDNYSPPCAGSARDCTAAQFFSLVNCQCECPYNPDGTNCPNPLQVFNPLTCQCEFSCPANSPTERDCYIQGLEWRDCACEGSNYCCQTSSSSIDYKLWAGYCWDETTEAGCNAEPNGRCTWSPNNCLPNPPVNTKDRKNACKFNNERCSKDKECCSEFCKVDGSCR